MTDPRGAAASRVIRALTFTLVLAGSLVLGVGLVLVLADAVTDDPIEVTPIELVTVTSSLPADSPTTVAETIAPSTTTPVTSEADGAAVDVPPTTIGADAGLLTAPTTPARPAAPPPATVAPPPPAAPAVEDDDDDDDDEDDDDDDSDDDADDDSDD